MASLIPQRPDAPYFDQSTLSRTSCQVGIGLFWLSGFLCLGFGIYLSSTAGTYVNLSGGTKEFITLSLNILVTLCNETAGYIHSVSLRWALQREGRLDFNSNLRLFNNSRTSRANAWYTNAFMVFSIILAHASTSLIFIGDVQHDPTNPGFGSRLPSDKNVYINGYALITLALGVLSQSLVASICLFNAKRLPTWSSMVIDIAAACHGSGAILHVPDRCIRSVHDRQKDASPAPPCRTQKSLCFSRRSARTVLYFLWTTVVLAIVWGVALIAIIRKSYVVQGISNGNRWSFFPNPPDSASLNRGTGYESANSNTTMTLAIPWLIVVGEGRANQGTIGYTSGQHIYFPSFIGLFLLTCVLQSFVTLSLHCAELIVNVTRDELTWRHGSKDGLGSERRNAAFSVISSLPGFTLLALKPLLHWIYSLAVSAYFSAGLVMHPPQILYLAVGAACLASFVTGCALWRPKGPQPAAYGHLQTLVNLIDDWPKQSETMYWGRKWLVPSIRFAKIESVNSSGEPSSELLLPVLRGLNVELQNMGTSDSISVAEAENRRGIPSEARDSSDAFLHREVDTDTSTSYKRQIIAHAGTASVKLGPIRFDEIYI